MNTKATWKPSLRTRIITRMFAYSAAFCLLLTYVVANY